MVRKYKYLVVSKMGAKGKGKYYGSYYKKKSTANKMAKTLRKQKWDRVRVMKTATAPKHFTF